MSEVRHKVTWNGCETCHGAVWTDEHGITACRGHYGIDRVLSGETDGQPDEPGCGWVEPTERAAMRSSMGLTPSEQGELSDIHAGRAPLTMDTLGRKHALEARARLGAALQMPDITLSNLSLDEREELARLEAADHLCSLGDRPMSPPVKNLRRMWELREKARSTRG